MGLLKSSVVHMYACMHAYLALLILASINWSWHLMRNVCHHAAYTQHVLLAPYVQVQWI